MSKIGISLSIDVTKIDKTKLITGKKGKYLDAQVFINLDELDQYGNSGMITQAISKEERQQGGRGEILGNCKLFWREDGKAAKPYQDPQAQPAQQPVDDFSDEIPF